MWGAKWLRMVRRKAAVEESWVREELAKPLPKLPVEPEIKDEVKMEDVTTTNGDSKSRSEERTVADNRDDGIE